MNKKNMLLTVCVCVVFGIWGLTAVDAADESASPSWQDHFITVVKILDVPAQYPTIQAALDHLDNKLISRKVFVTIQVADGVYYNYEPINVSHPNGDRIKILGNSQNPANCTINFLRTGLSVRNGNTLGMLDGFTFVGNEPTNRTYNTVGIDARYNGTIICGPNMVVKEFLYGLFAYMNSHITASNIITKSNTDYGIYASYSSSIMAVYATSSDNGKHGVFSKGSTIDFRYSTCQNNGQTGIFAIRGSYVAAVATVVRYNNVGITAGSNSNVRATYAVVADNNTDFNPAPNTCSNNCGSINH